MNLIDAILEGNASEVRGLVLERMQELVNERLESLKMKLQEETFEEVDSELVVESIKRSNIMKQGRTKTFKVRVRKGKIQRRKKFSAVKGYTIRGGKMTRMTGVERRNRRMAARKAKVKRRSKMGQALRKRRISLRKRKSLGL